MAFKITFKPKELSKKLDKYSAKSIRFVSYRSIEDLGPLLRDKNIKQRYKDLFIDPVPFTLNSLLFKNYDNKAKIDFFTFSDESKSNPPSKYLYPVIGGGSTEPYPTRFVQYLKNRNYMRKDQYPVANLRNTTDIKLNAIGNVKPTVYRNTIYGLAATKQGQFKGANRKSKKTKIHDGRVFAVTARGESKNKRLRPGIYRMVLEKNKEKVRPLFLFAKTPKIKPKQSFGVQISDIAERELPRFLQKNINKVGKSM